MSCNNNYYDNEYVDTKSGVNATAMLTATSQYGCQSIIISRLGRLSCIGVSSKVI